MSLLALTSLKLQDAPSTTDQGLYSYLLQIKRVLSELAGFGTANNRVITSGDLATLGLSTPRWNDIRFPATGSRIDISSGRLDYDYTNCGVNFASNARYPDEPLCAVVQLPHGKVIGTGLRPHIHWDQNQNAEPNWLMEWRWVNNGDLRGTYQQAVIENTKFQYSSGNLQQLSEFPELPPPPREAVSSVLDFRIFRDSANASGLFAGADSYVGDALLKEFDIHYQTDSFGSTQEFTK